MKVTFSVLPTKEYYAEYMKAFTPVDVPSEVDKERLRDAIQTTQKLVVDALDGKWDEVDDYEVGWDFDYCYHVCGGIYSDRIVCPEYLLKIASALDSAPQPEKWTYHTACESEKINGQFFIRNRVVYLPDSSPPALLMKLEAKP